MKILKYLALIPVLLLLSGCKSRQSRSSMPEVPLTINIRYEDRDLDFVNFDIFRFRLEDVLDDFQKVRFDLVAPDENPQLVLDLNFNSFTLWPKQENRTRRVVRRTIQVGTDANGKPVYQQVSAAFDLVQTQIRANAAVAAKLTFKGTPPKTFERSYGPNYTWRSVYVDNIQGDPRAIDPSLYTATMSQPEPEREDILMGLLREDMLRRLSNEIRSYYK